MGREWSINIQDPDLDGYDFKVFFLSEQLQQMEEFSEFLFSLNTKFLAKKGKYIVKTPESHLWKISAPFLIVAPVSYHIAISYVTCSLGTV